jgi:hypothetical protein
MSIENNLPPFDNLDDDGNYVGNDPRFMKDDESQTVGYLHFYIKDGDLKRKFIPVELKDSFIEQFGHDLLNADENEVDEFIKIKLNPKGDPKDGHEEAVEEFEKIENSFSSEEQYWACRAGFIKVYYISKIKYESKQQKTIKTIMENTKSQRGSIIDNIVTTFIKDYQFLEMDSFKQSLQEKLDESLDFKVDVLKVETQNDIIFGQICFEDENNTIKILNLNIVIN